jgi:hypothetical protein
MFWPFEFWNIILFLVHYGLWNSNFVMEFQQTPSHKSIVLNMVDASLEVEICKNVPNLIYFKKIYTHNLPHLEKVVFWIPGRNTSTVGGLKKLFTSTPTIIFSYIMRNEELRFVWDM